MPATGGVVSTTAHVDATTDVDRPRMSVHDTSAYMVCPSGIATSHSTRNTPSEVVADNRGSGAPGASRTLTTQLATASSSVAFQDTTTGVASTYWALVNASTATAAAGDAFSNWMLETSGA